MPFARLADSIAVCRAAFERRGLEYAIWGHASDGNLHPNLIPRSIEDVERSREAIQETARWIPQASSRRAWCSRRDRWMT